jgi:hypothetical protein
MIDRRVLTLFLAVSIPALNGSLYAQGNGHGHAYGKDKDHGDDDNHGHGKDHEHGKEHEHGNGNKDRGSHYFRQEDHQVIERYYRGPRDLPPGLAKKYYRTGTLPPGWQKHFQPFPPQLVAYLPPPPPNCERGFVDGQAVVFDRKTRVIVDALDIVSAFTSH